MWDDHSTTEKRGGGKFFSGVRTQALYRFRSGVDFIRINSGAIKDDQSAVWEKNFPLSRTQVLGMKFQSLDNHSAPILMIEEN